MVQTPTKLSHFINGVFVNTSSTYFESTNPATGKINVLVPEGGFQEVDAAAKAAAVSFPKWSSAPREKRAAIMNKIAQLVEERIQDFAIAESEDQGKTVALASTMDIPRVAYNFRYFASVLLTQTNLACENDGISLNYVQRMPVGVCGLISPWNLPLYLLSWKIAPAIAFGNTVVCKPSEFTSMTAFKLCELLNEAGVPPGVINMVFGTGEAGSEICKHSLIKTISFTGGTVTGEKILQTTAPLFKKVSLELGGKNPCIIFDDCNLDECVENTMRSSFANQGEICLCLERLFIQKSIYSEFMKKFLSKLETFRVGDPREKSTQMGPLVSEQHMNKVLSYFKMAINEGGKIAFGGGRVMLEGELSGGYFVQPTVITGLGTESRCSQEEIFGPVVIIHTFESEEEVIEMANNCNYGLAASVWTENGRKGRRVAERLQTGNVWINSWIIRNLNMPFGGMKKSGIGREGGNDSIEFFTEAKAIYIKN